MILKSSLSISIQIIDHQWFSLIIPFYFFNVNLVMFLTKTTYLTRCYPLNFIISNVELPETHTSRPTFDPIYLDLLRECIQFNSLPFCPRCANGTWLPLVSFPIYASIAAENKNSSYTQKNNHVDAYLLSMNTDITSFQAPANTKERPTKTK